MFAKPLPVTPIRGQRRKRVSLSSPKRPAETRPSDPYPMPTPPAQAALKLDNEVADNDLSLDFSFWDDETRTFNPIFVMQREELLEALMIKYPQVDAITISIPFCIIECEGSVPAESEQVFMAAGLVCVFVVVGCPLPFGAEFIGHYGEGEIPSETPAEVAEDCRPFHIPSMTTFHYIHKLIPDASYVSSYPIQLVVELLPVSPEEFNKKLECLPSGIGRLCIGYTNGTLLRHPQSRAKKPDSKNAEGGCDDSDYLAPLNGGSLRPGVLLECRGIHLSDGSIDNVMLSNSGVKVHHQDKVRFTCANHRWDGLTNKIVYHSGKPVGTITESLGEDIGLVSTQYPFSNQLLDVNLKAKKLLHSSLLPFGEFMVIDSAYTSKQRMRIFGLRCGKKEAPPDYNGPKKHYDYVQADQGIFSVKADIINREPKIRDGVCGTAIIHQGVSFRDQSALDRGEVVGFMHYTDVVGNNLDGRLYSYCQLVDPLIDEGWEVCDE